MYAKSLTAIMGFGFVAYGLYCFFQPDVIMKWIGYQTLGSGARTEFLAMYGGVQTAVGFFGLYALKSTDVMRANFVLLAFIFSSLVLGRIYGYLTMSDLGAYTMIVFIFELISVALCISGVRQLKM